MAPGARPGGPQRQDPLLRPGTPAFNAIAAGGSSPQQATHAGGQAAARLAEKEDALAQMEAQMETDTEMSATPARKIPTTTSTATVAWTR